MAIPRMNDDMDVIAKLADRPNDTQGLTAAQLKARFDKSGVDIQKYINDTLLPYLESGSAAASMGIEAIPGLDAETVQAALEEIYADKDVFWATYGSTTYSEVKAAYEAGKPVLCEYNGRYYLLTRPAAPGDINIYFTSPANVSNTGVSVYCVYVDYLNGWHNTSATVQPSIVAPLMDGEAAVGSVYSYARGDHVHPSDTSKADVDDVPTKVSDLTNDSGFITAADVPEEVIEIESTLNGTTITVSSLGGKTVQDLVDAKEVILHTGDGDGMFCLHRTNVVLYAVDLYILIFSSNVRRMFNTTDRTVTAVFTMVQSDATSMTGTFSEKTPYVKPSSGIPASELTLDVQTSLGKADSALQSVPNTYRTAAAQDTIDAGKITMPDGGSVGQVLKKTADGTEWANESGGGGGGTSNYNDLSNKPQIAGTTLSGNKSLADLGIAAASDIPTVPSAATAAPADLGTAAVGSSSKYAKEDHVHKLPTLSDLGAEPAWSAEANIQDGAVTKSLSERVSCIFTGDLTSLTITLGGETNGHYHFDFSTGSTAPTLTLPSSVLTPDGFQVEANKAYEVDILNKHAAIQSWSLS